MHDRRADVPLSDETALWALFRDSTTPLQLATDDTQKVREHLADPDYDGRNLFIVELGQEKKFKRLDVRLGFLDMNTSFGFCFDYHQMTSPTVQLFVYTDHEGGYHDNEVTFASVLDLYKFLEICLTGTSY